MELAYVFASVILILTSIYYYLTWNYNFWQKQGIPCAKGIIPGIGNIASVMVRKVNLAKLCEDFYKANEGCSMFGFYHMTTPSLLVRDPELVKNVLLTNFFKFFQTQSEFGYPDQDDLFSTNPFFSKTTESWKENRAPLSNAFSSKKLKSMFPIIQNVSSEMGRYLKEKIIVQNGKLELELKQFFNLYTGEIAATGIGIQSHNFKENDKSTTNEITFKNIIEDIFKGPSFSGSFSGLILIYWPWLARLLNLQVTPKEVDIFFRYTVKSLLSHRKHENINSSNFLQIIADYLKTNEPKIDEETVLASHMLSFSVEIYETSAITLSFLGFQLASHPKIQEKVREEMKNILKKYNGKLDYEALKEMTYFDQVLHESMRLNHIPGTIKRICTKETQLVGFDGHSCKIKPGHLVVISTFGLQTDPKYWPNPEEFDPDRFSEEQKAKRPKFVFLPFGEGPRICVGMRMANIIIKLAMVTFLKDYSLEVSPKTPLPLKKDPNNSLTVIEGGLWTILKPL